MLQDQIRKIGSGQTLFVAMYEPCIIHWSIDGWQTVHDMATQDTGLGLHLAKVETKKLLTGRIDTNEWRGRNFSIEIQSA